MWKQANSFFFPEEENYVHYNCTYGNYNNLSSEYNCSTTQSILFQ